jgi:hypothetical protein
MALVGPVCHLGNVFKFIFRYQSSLGYMRSCIKTNQKKKKIMKEQGMSTGTLSIGKAVLPVVSLTLTSLEMTQITHLTGTGQQSVHGMEETRSQIKPGRCRGFLYSRRQRWEARTFQDRHQNDPKVWRTGW